MTNANMVIIALLIFSIEFAILAIVSKKTGLWFINRISIVMSILMVVLAILEKIL